MGRPGRRGAREFKARLTYRILEANAFEQTFDLAEPGKEFVCYTKGVMKRVK